MPFRLLPKSMTLDDPERPICTLLQKICVLISEPTTKKLNEVKPILSAAKCSPMTLTSSDIRFMRIFARVPWESGHSGLSTTAIFSVFAGYFFRKL